MTEGPEASYLANYISKRFLKKRLRNIKIVAGRYKTHGPPTGFHPFTKSLHVSGGVRLVEVYKKGKIIFLFFDNGWCLIAKMGMVGWFYSAKDKPFHRADPHIIFEFEGISLIFSDFRNFGTLEFTNNAAKVVHEIESVAPDILDSHISLSQIQERITGINGKRKIDEVLMDQEGIFSGIGNIIKSEALYAAKISPKRNLDSLTSRDLETLFRKARVYATHVLHILDSEEIHSPKYVALQKVYQREKDPHGNVVKHYVSTDKRTTFWVPAIQE
jgi:formamidopyrimidine-DNA glycosylase